MSTDAKVTKDLVQTCKDGEEGFAKAAAKLAESGRDDLAGQFREFSEQRGQFVSELEGLAANYGDDAEKSSSVAAAIHPRSTTLRKCSSATVPDALRSKFGSVRSGWRGWTSTSKRLTRAAW